MVNLFDAVLLQKRQHELSLEGSLIPPIGFGTDLTILYFGKAASGIAGASIEAVFTVPRLA